MDPTMLFGGVEGGATHSNLVICDGTGKVIGTAKGPGTNHWILGIDECANRILAMLHDAKDDANIPRDKPLDALALTLSGCEEDSTNAQLAARVLEKDGKCARAVYVASDTAGSLFTGAPSGGIVLIAGTGSNALMRTAEGEQFGCGGWGYLLGDEGAAYWIAHRAVKTIFDDVDGLQPASYPTDRVWEAIREHFNIDTRTDLLAHAYAHFDKSMFAGLTAKLSHLASTGDRLSRQLFADAGCTLADHIAALTRHSHTDRMRVVCVGSVWKSWTYLQPGMVKQLKNKNVKMELEFVRLRVSSALGAAYLAAKHVNYQLPRDDGAFCEVFYTSRPGDENGAEIYIPENINRKEKYERMNGTVNGKVNGIAYENGSNGDCVNES
uniref:N-acetyl-D-glucosamine kinase n=2 Tax=Pectinophora gossypiella TaxID=13191 RepID=A0A1E1WQC2_PECGO